LHFKVNGTAIVTARKAALGSLGQARHSEQHAFQAPAGACATERDSDAHTWRSNFDYKKRAGLEHFYTWYSTCLKRLGRGSIGIVRCQLRCTRWGAGMEGTETVQVTPLRTTSIFSQIWMR